MQRARLKRSAPSGENGGVKQPLEPEEGDSLDRLSELLGHHVQFSYTAWDRIVLHGYLDRLQCPEKIISFFRDVVGAPSVTPEVVMRRTAPYRAWVARYAEEQGDSVRAGAQRRAQGRARRPVLPAVQAG